MLIPPGVIGRAHNASELFAALNGTAIHGSIHTGALVKKILDQINMAVSNCLTEGTCAKLITVVHIGAPLDELLGNLMIDSNGLGENTLVVRKRCARIGARREQDADAGELVKRNCMVENGVAEVANVIHVAAQLDELGDERRTLEQVDGIRKQGGIGHLVAIQTRDDGDLLFKRRVRA
jgi:hypothetical protein